MWIQSHIGIAGNELADTRAGTANQKPNIELQVKLELQEAYSLVDKHILDLWQQNWNTCATWSFHRKLIPKVSNNIINIQMSHVDKTWSLQDSNYENVN